MESLGEAYTDSRWADRDPRRVFAGLALFVAGTLTIVVGILAVTTPLSAAVGASGEQAAQKLAGVLAGVGIPAVLLGVVAVLPSRRRERLGVLAGATLCLAGVGLFEYAYPTRWTGTGESLAFPTAMVYFLGGSIAFWFVLRTVADFRTRNNPRGTVELELTREGRTRTVEVSHDEYQRYRQAIRGDGGETEQVVRELESRFDD
ncbi:MAG: hypothetical protein ABEH35_04060 [Haloarculaceae archaeon]